MFSRIARCKRTILPDQQPRAKRKVLAAVWASSPFRFERLEQRCYFSALVEPATTDSALAMDANGNLDAVYYSNNTLYYSTESNGSWSAPQAITTLASDPGNQISLAIAPDGQV